MARTGYKASRPSRPSLNTDMKMSDSRRGSAVGSPIDSASTTKCSLHSEGLDSASRTPSDRTLEDTVGAEISVKLEPGKAPKLTRTASHKVPEKSPTLYLDQLDRYDEATSSFQVIHECSYANKYLGSTEPALECDCTDEWNSETKRNHACGEDSDCINRATKMECSDDCGCGTACQNQRFQRKQYAKVTVFKTEKKGYGLRADTNLRPNEFIFEYIGEVINEPAFRRRMRSYDEEGIKHFYFMSLTKGEFVDATKKGNLGRFCNHSCLPNCYVDKWVVGDKLRMGIFAEKHIKAGEELVFNYNVDRYGAEPQPCYCGEPNCTGFIGGKTQTEKSTKLSNATIEALGIDDYDDWEFAVAKKPKKPRKTEEYDEEYVNNVQPKSLEEDGVTKVMAALMQCKEKWIAVKLLGRIQRVSDDKVMNRVVRMHGYRILKTSLSTFLEDTNVCKQVLDILFKLPRITRNKIADSKIEETVEQLKQSEDEQVATQATEILQIWSKLEIGYRIPRMKRDPNATKTIDRRSDRPEPRKRSRSRERSISPPSAPSGPRSNVPQRNQTFFRPHPFRRPPPPPPHSQHPSHPRQPPQPLLPEGWFQAFTTQGRPYYYNKHGQTQWTRPTAPAIQPPPPPKEPTRQDQLKQLIDQVLKEKEEESNKASAASTPGITALETKATKREEKWRSYPEEKQKRIYEHTLFPHIKYVTDKYKHKLPKEDIKRFGKDVAKKLANSDFKRGRVNDPTQISSSQVKAVKGFVKDFFDKAVVKRRERDRREAEKLVKEQAAVPGTSAASESATPAIDSIEDEVKLSDNEMSDLEFSKKPYSRSPEKSPDRKRKRGEDGLERSTSPVIEDDDDSIKKLKLEVGSEEIFTPPPPPPPPPAADTPSIGTPDLTEDMNMEDVQYVKDAVMKGAAGNVGLDESGYEELGTERYSTEDMAMGGAEVSSTFDSFDNSKGHGINGHSSS